MITTKKRKSRINKSFLLALLFMNLIHPGSGRLYCADGHDEGILNEIMGHKSDSIIIGNTRQLIYSSILKKNYEKAAQAVKYLEAQYNGTKIQFLHPFEKWSIVFLNKEYGKIIDLALQDEEFDSFQFHGYYSHIFNDEMENKLYELMTNQETNIIRDISQSRLLQTEKQFIIISLKFFLYKPSSDEINKLILTFIEEYPYSRLSRFIKRNYIYLTKKGNWGYGLEFDAGYGFFNSALNRLFDHDFGWGIGLELHYKKLSMHLSGYYGFYANTRNSYIYDNTLIEKDSTFTTFVSQLYLGYTLIDIERWAVYPIGGIGGFTITSSGEAEKKIGREININSSLCYVYGIMIDFKYPRNGACCFLLPGRIIMRGPHDDSYAGYRIRFTVTQPMKDNAMGELKGCQFNISIGFVAILWPVKRIL